MENKINTVIKSFENRGYTTKRWQNYGKDRLYISKNNRKKGYIDLVGIEGYYTSSTGRDSKDDTLVKKELEILRGE